MMDPNIRPEITPKRYPLGDSSFTAIREARQMYVDKTAFVYKLADEGKYYFLSRPRRFGKSLLLSTMKAYFQGHRELFDGLAISQLETEWRRHPVIHLSMGGKDFSSADALRSHLDAILDFNQISLGVSVSGSSPEERFVKLIGSAASKFGEKVVVLIDEYDKPMLDTRHRNPELHTAIKNQLRGFYGCIKESADFLRFVFITGITKFSHVNIFSGLNNLNDISLDSEYNSICGISESEMHEYFGVDLEMFAAKNKLSHTDAANEFKLMYDGYRFAQEGENIYNPYSTLSAFSKMKFGMFWFTSGTSQHLVEELRENHYNFEKLDGIEVTEQKMMGQPDLVNNPVALLYQSGYLTIKDYEYGIYTLGFPNREVSSGFYGDLLELILPSHTTDFSAQFVALYANRGEPEKIMEQLQIALSKYNCMEVQKPEYEYQLKAILRAIILAANLDVEGEVLTPAGRIDMVLKTKRYIYLFEFKMDSTPEDALNQINNKDYPFKYYGDTRQIIKIGANYTTEFHRLTGWVIES